jgi:hypothetical protein
MHQINVIDLNDKSEMLSTPLRQLWKECQLIKGRPDQGWGNAPSILILGTGDSWLIFKVDRSHRILNRQFSRAVLRSWFINQGFWFFFFFKSFFLGSYIYIRYLLFCLFFFSWMKNGNYDWPLKQTPIFFQ